MYAILKNEFDDNHLHWIKSCEKFAVKYIVIDFTAHNWVAQIKANDKSWSGFLVCPSGRQSIFKDLYDERLMLLNQWYNPKMFFPSLPEVLLHENKKYLSYWLEFNNLPCPKTWVFYDSEEALQFVTESSREILVGKVNIGASGKGVRVLRGAQAQMDYVKKAFSEGLTQSWGPNLAMGGWMPRLRKLITQPGRILKRLKVYNINRQEVQRGFVLLQEYIPHEFEWRVVRIGDSFFGHRKIKQGDKASGTKGIDYTAPSEELLNFTEHLTNKFGFHCMAIDLFEDGNGGYLINEMQCIFGHVQPFICELNGEPGRFVRDSSGWKFEQGFFNTNLSYDLRLEYFISSRLQ
jgi:hypothetical protein